MKAPRLSRPAARRPAVSPRWQPAATEAEPSQQSARYQRGCWQLGLLRLIIQPAAAAIAIRQAPNTSVLYHQRRSMTQYGSREGMNKPANLM